MNIRVCKWKGAVDKRHRGLQISCVGRMDAGGTFRAATQIDAAEKNLATKSVSETVAHDEHFVS
jgi:hypothetical protein